MRKSLVSLDIVLGVAVGSAFMSLLDKEEGKTGEVAAAEGNNKLEVGHPSRLEVDEDLSERNESSAQYSDLLSPKRPFSLRRGVWVRRWPAAWLGESNHGLVGVMRSRRSMYFQGWLIVNEVQSLSTWIGVF
ncbi:hypothetical protein PtA15_1A649 [Puccinia triticina]|uniref:Uncharacterized protein n=1 Tax=Puccinia triticina TaxID=208348 RepID=A0ABY7C9F0_9BASI|nr:uncharacterized protein PtA15_1A649 [Puccinia triticina]WAQ81309.1 hypothetical protein PtA15_1A649 [Puccinia triticina]